MPVTAALVVGISSRHIAGGYSDATIRLWHMDDVYLADLTEQLATGQIQQSDLALLQEQLMPLGASSYNAYGSFNPFAGLSFGSNVNLAGSTLKLDALGLDVTMQHSSPPLSPSGLAGQIAGQLVSNAFSTASQLLREGSGTMLGVELLQGSEKVKRRGCWCARLRDNVPSTPSRTNSNSLGPLSTPPPAATAAAGSSGARSTGGTGPVPASPRAAAEAAVDAAALTAGVSSAAVPKALQCLACGSQDQQLVRALKDFVAIRTVSNNRVGDKLRGTSACVCVLPCYTVGAGVQWPVVHTLEGSADHFGSRTALTTLSQRLDLQLLPVPLLLYRCCTTSACVAQSLCLGCWRHWGPRSRWRSRMTARTLSCWAAWATTPTTRLVRATGGLRPACLFLTGAVLSGWGVVHQHWSISQTTTDIEAGLPVSITPMLWPDLCLCPLQSPFTGITTSSQLRSLTGAPTPLR